MPKVIIVAGPNGAGKTSFARELLRASPQSYVYINADEIARSLRALGLTERVEIRAGRSMLRQLDDAIASRRDVMFETTLATLVYKQKIPKWKAAGYSIGLLYLRLPSVEVSIARVARRVAEHGHDIPEATIRQRFGRSLDYLDRHYKPICNEWYVCDSFEGQFVQADSWTGA